MLSVLFEDYGPGIKYLIATLAIIAIVLAICVFCIHKPHRIFSYQSKCTCRILGKKKFSIIF